MFGYVTIYNKELDKAEQNRYQAYYCGLCCTLQRRYGLAGQMTLSYDLTFVALVLSALYEPKTDYSEGRCLPHPVHKRPRADNEFLDYAADMTVALAYYNYMDNWQDDHHRPSLQAAKKLQPYLADIKARWPRQMEAIERQLAALNELEGQNSHDLDALCRCFGTLLGAIFACKDDVFRDSLEGMGRGLGGFIYLMDAYDDYEKDKKKGRYNALSELAATLPLAEYETRCHDLLTQQMGLCAQQFSLLPILNDTPEGKLIYNTVYSGVWCTYARVKKYREGHSK